MGQLMSLHACMRGRELTHNTWQTWKADPKRQRTNNNNSKQESSLWNWVNGKSCGLVSFEVVDFQIPDLLVEFFLHNNQLVPRWQKIFVLTLRRPVVD